MYRLFFTAILCLPLVACGGSKKTCSSREVLDALHDKLVIGMNYQAGVDGYYDGQKAKITLTDPRTIGPSGDFMRCSVRRPENKCTLPAAFGKNCSNAVQLQRC